MNLNSKIQYNLFLTYFKSNNLVRDNEILDTLYKNIGLNIFNNITVLTENEESTIGLKPLSSIINIIQINKRPTYQDFFNLSNLNFKKVTDINILANSDIIFTKSIKLINSKTIKSTFICLTRYELDGKIFWPKIPLEKGGAEVFHDYSTSQDAWIWIGKNWLNKCNFFLGIPGCDNKIAYEAYIQEYKILNPSLDIITYHNHKSNIREGSSNADKYNTSEHLRPHLYCVPSHINEYKSVAIPNVKDPLKGIDRIKQTMEKI
jgi:hypothetical protein